MVAKAYTGCKNTNGALTPKNAFGNVTVWFAFVTAWNEPHCNPKIPVPFALQ